jgi:hypothetical protein
VTLLSLTIRDAQHLSFKTFKKFEAFDEKRVEALADPTQLAQKLAQVAQKIKAADVSPQEKERLGRMLSELVFGLFVLAERSGISLEDAFLAAVDEMIMGFVT